MGQNQRQQKRGYTYMDIIRAEREAQAGAGKPARACQPAPRSPLPTEDDSGPDGREGPQQAPGREAAPRADESTGEGPRPQDGLTTGPRFKAALDAAGLSQQEAARKLGVRPATVSEWCSGKACPSLARSIDLVARLGLDPRLIAPEWFR